MNTNPKRVTEMEKVIWSVLVLTAIAVWFFSPSIIWQYIFFLRMPLIMGLFLLLLPKAAKDWLPAILKNLFVLRNKWQLAAVIISAIAAGISVVLVASIIIHNAPERFGVPVILEISEFWQYAIAIGLSAYICFVTIDLSREKLQSQDIKWGAFVGLVASIGLVIFTSLLRNWLGSNALFKETAASAFSMIKHGVEGYINLQNNELTEGHLTAIAFLLVGTVIYIAVGLIFNPESNPDRPEAPALFYLLLILSMATLFYGGASFYLDYFRVPVFIILLLFSAFTYYAFGVDHYFQLDPLTENQDNKQAINSDAENFKQILDTRLQHQTGERTLVIVCASGGGIQAAGWTAQVLTRLQDEDLLGKSFTKAIGLISAVSGGSVGTMYYLDRFIEDTKSDSQDKGYPQDHELDCIFKSATKDSLDAVSWGLAYLDIWRFIGLPFVVRKNFDRGTAVETDWQGEMRQSGTKKTLATWRKQIFAGEIPIPIFNATLVEDGRRFLISPMTFCEKNEKKYVDFNTLYNSYDINVVTAARLSSTFPYVSPICRSNQNIPGKNYHIADGGYFDNSGFVTIAEWLNKWLKPEKQLNIQRVLVLQINAFPETSFKKDNKSEDVKGDGGWFMATIGPLLAMFKVRDPIQANRNATEADLLKNRWKAYQDKSENKDGVDIQYFSIFFPSEEDAPEFYKNGRYQPPLSWRLTDKEKKAIQEGWNEMKKGRKIQAIKKLWRETWGISD
ncbi:patatin-like phospholipase family protein [Nostoc linckia FACHB-104]|nr:patatin-like phospholipase family protein [Nostoc linckia FACHB-104]